MKAFIVLALALVSLSSFAQRGGRGDREGSVTLGDGRNIVRIEVGDDRDDREMLRRVRRLEQAVREMQEQVYQLQSTPAPRRSYVACSGQFFSVGTVSARGNTETEARGNLAQACEARGNHSMHCDASGTRNSVRCERGEE